MENVNHFDNSRHWNNLNWCDGIYLAFKIWGVWNTMKDELTFLEELEDDLESNYSYCNMYDELRERIAEIKVLRIPKELSYNSSKKKIPISSIDGKPMPIEAIEGLISALNDFKEGRYEVVSNAPSPNSSLTNNNQLPKVKDVKGKNGGASEKEGTPPTASVMSETQKSHSADTLRGASSSEKEKSE